MLQDHFISKLLDMEEVEFTNIEIQPEKAIIEIRKKRKVHRCPSCGELTDQVHDYRLQKVKDLPVQGRKLVWHYHKRRYSCHSCQKRFYESNYLLPKWHRITNRTAAFCLELLKGKRSQANIAQELGVSPSTVGRWLNLLCFGRPSKLPAVLSIDEFRGNTDEGKFQCILTDPVHKTVLDILPNRYGTQLSIYFRSFANRQDVRYFVMDMNREYLALAKHHFPKATVVIDLFHVVRYCTWALENVRKRVQKALPAHERKYFKRSRKLLLTSMAKLSEENKAAVERMLLVSVDLREAYLLKEKFYEFMQSSSSQQAKERLHTFRLFAAASDIPEFQTCLTMLKNWQPYILNAFDCSYSNGFTEGVNNTIKVIKRIAYGYRNFDSFRKRILLTLNQKTVPAALA